MSESDGAVVLYTPQGTVPVELFDEDAMHVRFAQTIGARARLVHFDKPGIGASDPFDRDRVPCTWPGANALGALAPVSCFP